VSRDIYEDHSNDATALDTTWTDADVTALARTMKIAALKQIDLNISDHRWRVLAAALLNAGWHR
jgi:hypothetical protein